MTMIVLFIIHLAHFDTRCFSLDDLKVNIEFSLKRGERIVSVEAV